jgi:DNA-binding response OmpR family regulator
MKWRILLVDDEPDIRLIVRTTLEPEYEILEAHDGLDALEKIRRYEPDFVLMDVMMPLMNGFEACAAIRNDPRFRELPVMFLSALGAKDDMKKGFSSGANYYLTKPFDPARLRKNIDVFFQTTPPPRRQRRYTIEEIREFESSGRMPVAPGGDSFEDQHGNEDVHYRVTAEVRRPDSSSSEVNRQQPPAVEIQPRVMVVDDDRAIVDMIRLSLDGIAEVCAAYDGIEAIDKLVKYQPDILIIDIMLPRMNGFQLTQSLRANRAFARLPIMMCSAKGQERDIAFAKRMGANEFLPKPFSPADLITKVRELQKLPGFRVRPKSLEFAQIVDMEVTTKKGDVFQADDEARREHESQAKGNMKSISKFLKEQGEKDALDRNAQPEEKKKRRFFGFRGD